MRNIVKERKYFFIFILAVLLFLLRIYALDGDLVSWGKSWYQPVDEGAYGILGINQFKYGEINPGFQNINNYIAPHVRTNLIGNLFIYLGMSGIGNNLYGFRISSIICMIINFCLVFFILNTVQKKYFFKINLKNANRGKYIILFYFICEFTFLMASRTVETSIYRLLFFNLILLVYLKFKDENNIKYILLGFLAMFSVTGIYITNLFIFIATSIIVLITLLEKNKTVMIKIFSCYIFGCLLAYGLCEWYFQYFWDTSILQNTYDTIFNFSSLTEYTNTNNIMQAVTRAFHFFSSNFNLYNISILLTFLLILPKLLFYIIKKKDETLFFILLLYFLFLAQTIITEDFIIRKYIVVSILPIILIYLFYSLEVFRKFKVKSLRFKLLNFVYGIICSSFCVFILIYRLKLIGDGSELDFSRLDKYAIFIPSLLSVVSIFLLYSSNFFKIISARSQMFFCCLVFSLSIFVNLYMGITNIYTNKLTFTDKEIMEDLANYNVAEAGNNYLVGTYAHSYSLYNNFMPILDNYEEMMSNLVNNSEIYFFDYSTNWNIGYGIFLKDILSEKGYQLVIIKEYKRSYKTFGLSRDLALYKVEKLEY